MALDPQVQIKLIDVASRKTYDTREEGETIDQYLKRFEKIYKALIKSVS